MNAQGNIFHFILPPTDRNIYQINLTNITKHLLWGKHGRGMVSKRPRINKIFPGCFLHVSTDSHETVNIMLTLVEFQLTF